MVYPPLLFHLNILINPSFIGSISNGLIGEPGNKTLSEMNYVSSSDSYDSSHPC